MKQKKEITLCGKCKNWEFDRFTSNKMGHPWGACKLSRTANGDPANQSLSFAHSNITEGIKTWQATSEKYGCVQGTSSRKNINWSEILNFRIATVDDVIASYQK